jgi:hypothetical protein
MVVYEKIFAIDALFLYELVFLLMRGEVKYER